MGYVDLMKETRNFTPLGASTLPLDSKGWPLADAEILVLDDRDNQFYNGPDPGATAIDIGGTYHLSFTGQAFLSPGFPRNYSVANQVYNAATNTTTADLVVTHHSLQMLYIDFTSTYNPASATKAGVSNIRLIQPGYAADTQQLFSDDMLNGLEPFTTIRYLNIDGVNNDPVVFDSNGRLVPLEWSQRRLPNAASQTSGPGAVGQAWEYMVALANETNTDLWINVPGSASDDYVTQLANLIKNGSTVDGVTYAGLNPNLKVDLEFSNEVWGGIAGPTWYNQLAARQRVQAGGSDLNNDGSTDPNVWSQRYYLERSEEITSLFRGVFGADPTYNRLRPILGWQSGNDYFYTSTFSWFEQNHGTPREYFYGMGAANYGSATDLSSVDGFFNSLNADLATQFATTSRLATVATYYGLQTVAYEGGPNSFPSTAAQGQVALAASRDPRMDAYVTQLYKTWYAAGGGLASVYNGPYGMYSPSQQYALAETSSKSNPMSSPKYRGIVKLTQASPSPVTAGISLSATGPTTIPLDSDSLGSSFFSPRVGQSNKWLLNVGQAGDYLLTLKTPTTLLSTGLVSVSLADGTSLGTFSLGGGSSQTVISLSLRAGLNTLEISTLSPLTVINLFLTPKGSPVVTGSGLLDSGFESVQLAPGVYLYNAPDSPWTFSNQAGLATNGSGFTVANPGAPEGRQVAFLQNQGTISQTINNLAAGSYHLDFLTARRANYTNSSQAFQVLVDNQVVGTFSTSGKSYVAKSTGSFSLGGGTHVLTFQGLNRGGDSTALLDAINLVAESSSGGGTDTIPPPVATATSFADAGFETNPANANGSGFVYGPTGSAWNFKGTAGVAANRSGFTVSNPDAPEGRQVAFLQNQGSISQTITNLAAGTYHISFAMAQRANYTNTSETFQVLVDNQVVGIFTTSGTSYQSNSSSGFSLGAGSHVFTFQGMNRWGDSTALLDAVSLVADSATNPGNGDPSSIADSGFENLAVQLGPMGYVYAPQGSAWTFTGQAGVSANQTGFTVGNPNAPEGSRVGFVQNQGMISQSFQINAAGNFQLGFLAAQRANYTNQMERIQLWIDGQLLMTYDISSREYQNFSSPTVTLTKGSHVITFKGVTNRGDATALLDKISLNRLT